MVLRGEIESPTSRIPSERTANCAIEAVMARMRERYYRGLVRSENFEISAFAL